jgi:uncharacterized lipoprotein YehR (DUF1307 family)
MKKQSKLKDNRKKIEVAYFWKNDKIVKIITKSQILYPEEHTIKVVKKMIRQIKKLGGVPTHPHLSEYISRSEVLKIVGEKDGTNKDSGTDLVGREQKSRSKRKTDNSK